MSHFPHHHRRSDDPAVSEPPVPLTEDQLKWITEENETTANRAIAAAEAMDRRRARHRLVGFAVLFLAFLGNVWYSAHIASESRDQLLRSGDIVAVDGCNRDFQERLEIRGVLIESKNFTRQAYERGAFPKSELRLRLAFYDERLQSLPLLDCRRADEVLTDDPDKPLVVPRALFPQSTEQVVPPVSSEGEKP
jgi:hypothetical protein